MKVDATVGLAVQVPQGQKVKLKYPYFHTPLFNGDVTLSPNCPVYCTIRLRKNIWFTHRENGATELCLTRI